MDGAVTTTKIADGAVSEDKLADGSVSSVKLSDMGAGIGQYLKYTGAGWVPGDLSSLTYAGNWNATSNSPNLSGGGSLGEFYIVNVAGTTDLLGGSGTNSWSVGDWAVWNNVLGQWEKIDNATNVQSFNGRNGIVVPANNDYTWNQIDKSVSAIGDIADVDLSTPPTTGQILKFDGTNWVPSEDLSSGGAGSVSTAEIADATITNADISGSAAIDYTKLDIADAEIPQAKVNGLTSLASSVATNTSSISTINSTLPNKVDNTITLTAGDGLTGGGDLSTSRTFNIQTDGTTIEVATDTLKIVDGGVDTTQLADGAVTNAKIDTVAATKITTACSDGEVLSASSGFFVCAASTTVGNWTLNATDLYYNLGNVGIGTATPSDALHVEKENAWATHLSSVYGTTHYPAFAGYRYRGSVGTPLVLADGDITATWIGAGYDGSVLRQNARIEFAIDGTPSSNNVPGKIVFRTNSGAGTTTEKMILNSSGDVGIGTMTPSEKLEVVGTIKATSFEGNGSSLTNVAAASANTVTASSGSAAAPSISFGGDADTGFYQASSGSDSIDIAIGGANIFNLSSSGIVSPSTGGASVSTSNGSASAPTFSFSGDEDTGWYRASADTLAAATAGAERVRIDSSGNVGIGTASPQNNLHVNAGTGGGVTLESNDGVNIDFRFRENGTNKFNLGFIAATDDFSIYDNTAGAHRLYIQNDGAVGIGSTAPTARLQVNANATSGGNGILLYDNNSSSAAPFVEVRGRRSDGNGSQSFSGGLALSGLRTDAAVATGKHLGTVYFGGNHTNGTEANLAYTSSISAIAEGTFSNVSNMPTGLSFYTGSTGTNLSTSATTFGTERMRITNSGKVGIGTSSPVELLTISDPTGNNEGEAGIFLEDPTVNDGTYGAKISYNDKSGSNELKLATISAGVETGSMIIQRVGGNIGFNTASPEGAFHFEKDGAFVMHMRGHADDAVTGTPFVIMQKSRGTQGVPTAVLNGDQLGAVEMGGYGASAYSGAQASIKAIAEEDWTDAAQGTRLQFDTTPIGSNVRTNAMIIKPSGNVGIGTTTPAEKLEVTGNLKVTGKIIVGMDFVNLGLTSGAGSNTVITCTNGGTATDCICNDTDSIIMNGGTYVNTTETVRESRPVGVRTWRIACVNSSNVSIDCPAFSGTCAKMGAP